METQDIIQQHDQIHNSENNLNVDNNQDNTDIFQNILNFTNNFGIQYNINNNPLPNLQPNNLVPDINLNDILVLFNPILNLNIENLNNNN